jgi:hypothetical protein
VTATRGWRRCLWLADSVHYVEFMRVNQIRVASWNLCHGRADLDLLEAQSPALVLA